jgi:hypothetical protein
MQSANLCLTTTTPEELVASLQWFMQPLKLLKVNVAEVALTLLLSLRFTGLVFDEVRMRPLMPSVVHINVVYDYAGIPQVELDSDQGCGNGPVVAGLQRAGFRLGNSASFRVRLWAW